MKTIFVLGGLLSRNKDGTYRSQKLNYVRVLAAYYLYKNLVGKESVKLIVSGGKGIYEKIQGIPPVAKVMKRELVKLGLHTSEIAEESKTASTYRELIWLKNYTNKHPKEVIVAISNTYHLPRIKAMINYFPKLRELKNLIKLQSAEKIAIKFNRKLKTKLDKFNGSREMKKIISLENKGITDLKTGTYKIR